MHLGRCPLSVCLTLANQENNACLTAGSLAFCPAPFAQTFLGGHQEGSWRLSKSLCEQDPSLIALANIGSLLCISAKSQ